MGSLVDLGRDLAGVAGLAVLAMIAGVAINRFSERPLTMVYQSPEQRLQSELSELVAAPPLASFPVDTIDLDQFRSAVDNRSAIIFDARSSSYYSQGHVPGALNLSRDNFAADYMRLASALERAKDRAIIVYCSGGACHDSKMVAQALTSLGFNNVRIFADGWDAWARAGLPADHGTNP